jgi:hypothetical protein
MQNSDQHIIQIVQLKTVNKPATVDSVCSIPDRSKHYFRHQVRTGFDAHQTPIQWRPRVPSAQLCMGIVPIFHSRQPAGSLTCSSLERVGTLAVCVGWLPRDPHIDCRGAEGTRPPWAGRYLRSMKYSSTQQSTSSGHNVHVVPLQLLPLGCYKAPRETGVELLVCEKETKFQKQE